MTAISPTYKNEQKLDSMCLSLKFLKDWIEDDGITRVDPMKVDGDKIASSTLYDAYVSWCGNTAKAVRPEIFHMSIAKIGISPPRNLKIQGIQMKALVVNKEAVRAGFRDAFKMPGFDWSEQ